MPRVALSQLRKHLGFQNTGKRLREDPANTDQHSANFCFLSVLHGKFEVGVLNDTQHFELPISFHIQFCDNVKGG